MGLFKVEGLGASSRFGFWCSFGLFWCCLELPSRLKGLRILHVWTEQAYDKPRFRRPKPRKLGKRCKAIKDQGFLIRFLH